MKLAIIADDLTGANDSGVQLARHGLKTSVLFNMDEGSLASYDTVVFDTDSRSISSEEAYDRVYRAAKLLMDNGFDTIFKKMDSTMRGNIGIEIDAVYDVVQPDFMMIAPGYPKNNRTIREGIHYLNGVPLAETEIALDPKTPVTISYLPDLLKQQTKYNVGEISVTDLEAGQQQVHAKLEQLKQNNIPYVLVDSTEERHLELILQMTHEMPYTFAWAGSAGIANYLPAHYELESKPAALTITPNSGPILTVVGSVNKNSREQLYRLLRQSRIASVSFHSFKAVSAEEDRTAEMERVYDEIRTKALEGQDVVLYSTAESIDIELARATGENRGLNPTEVSNEIVRAIGEICARLLEEGLFKGVSMTGGDTAKQICIKWNISGFELLDELEIGVPISRFMGIEDLYVITKAGGFGKPDVFIHAIQKLKGGILV
ncbi:four-carbon acid sugar kinase family protein [Paenibacillus silvae]|uniref:four-carbon acid sugar kinase family protein n=1 Tax=Paenibacillus silvae TaxID=1325358 RepID=UPI0020064D8B|nr:four-carbon acid sugar kinase family protein [Paenibacillus silvae]MCK6077690.1 four-carbon acid sugar kinase family protein [Paenibacillus silvae]MCK6151890.1 four-carbon acid sugar kinase family protein [Paenibacillus silvae]MCK6270574.1 four-carbon acid sugar kinase family protein [Paenibacillus silvae]